MDYKRKITGCNNNQDKTLAAEGGVLDLIRGAGIALAEETCYSGVISPCIRWKKNTQLSECKGEWRVHLRRHQLPRTCCKRPLQVPPFFLHTQRDPPESQDGFRYEVRQEKTASAPYDGHRRDICRPQAILILESILSTSAETSSGHGPAPPDNCSTT